MLKILKASQITAKEIVSARDLSYADVESGVRELIADVIKNGDAAVRKYTLTFDKADIADFKVGEEETNAALERTGAEFIRILERAAKNIERFHAAQLRRDFALEYDGITVGQRFLPVGSAGIYVPGGTARYPSSVLMNAVPARLAGVKNIIMCTPPSPDGSIPDNILVAAKVAGVNAVYKAGGAQAIAAMAYGTESIPRVDKIAGPGNVYVATAKKLVQGAVGIDMIAGPSEILVIADKYANPEWVAADLLSQAEHDKLASAILLTDDLAFAEKCAEAVERRMAKLPRREIAAASIAANGRIVLTEDLDEAARIADEIAPEHLELAVRDCEELLKKIKNAGSVFLGYYTPEATGDYMAGANHTLPTGGTARFSSPLGVDDFIKKSQFIRFTPESLGSYADDIAAFARTEGLTAHAESVEVRVKK